ncbi:melatonin receptor pdcr-1-like [Tubulanus polymorphus]|uniref:melatonin receptor pdcr-1-like n=1 Tax=Tubulanus polymorphus TaxID=672921 RepID=UPI003DA6B030
MNTTTAAAVAAAAAAITTSSSANTTTTPPFNNLNPPHDIRPGFKFESFVILIATIAIIMVNVIILLILFKNHALRCINKYFFSSVTIADLLMGVFVTPFSFVASIFDKWEMYEFMCHVQAYFGAILLLASVYSMMLISLDHYVAIKKPERYSMTMSPVRCMCWILFSWLTALSFCCPPLFGVARAEYYWQGYICIIDWELQKAYFITSGVVITLPPILALVFAHGYLFTNHYKAKRDIYEKFSCVPREMSRPRYYFINFVAGLVFFLSWMSWCILRIDHMKNDREGSRYLHFYLLWIGLANSIWKFGVYCAMGVDFRCGLKSIFLTRSRCTCKN